MNFYLSFSERLALTARMIVPYSFMAPRLLLAMISVPMPLAILMNTSYVLMIVYYWALYRPTLLPHGLVVVAGLFIDFMLGFPIGLHAFLLLLLIYL